MFQDAQDGRMHARTNRAKTVCLRPRPHCVGPLGRRHKNLPGRNPGTAVQWQVPFGALISIKVNSRTREFWAIPCLFPFLGCVDVEDLQNRRLCRVTRCVGWLAATEIASSSFGSEAAGLRCDVYSELVDQVTSWWKIDEWPTGF